MTYEDWFGYEPRIVEREPWMESAACRGVAIRLFFTQAGESTREAKAICRECPVRQECLEFALAGPERFGVWGGLSERERKTIRTARLRRIA